METEKLTKTKIRNELHTIFVVKDRMNELIGNLEKTLRENITEEDASELSDIFNDIRGGKDEDVDDIMRKLYDINEICELPYDIVHFDDDVIEKAKKLAAAKELINEAIKKGVLQAAGKERVYICVSENGSENDEESFFWEPILLDEAAADLLENEGYEVLKKAVDEAVDEKQSFIDRFFSLFFKGGLYHGKREKKRS